MEGIGKMSENMKDIRDELILLRAMVDSIVKVYAKPKSTIIAPNDDKVQLELKSADYIKGLFNNIVGRAEHLTEMLVKMN